MLGKRKILPLFIVLIILFLLMSCQKTNLHNAGYSDDSYEPMSSDVVDVSDTLIEDSVTSSRIEETPITKISSQCDLVLADGTDEGGNLFELVANETEDYTGTVIKIGVIKNNQWLIEPDEKHPFVHDGHMLYGSGITADLTLKDIRTNVYVKYVGNGCFTLDEKILYNCNNSLSIDLRKFVEYPDRYTAHFFQDYYDTDCNNRSNYMIFSYDNSPGYRKYDFHICSLNTQTMEVKELNVKKASDYMHCDAYNDGLFFCGGLHAFCDINGNAVIDLSNYYIYYDTFSRISPPMVFDNGYCTFPIKNDQGTLYDITIDKTGKVVTSKLH